VTGFFFSWHPVVCQIKRATSYDRQSLDIHRLATIATCWIFTSCVCGIKISEKQLLIQQAMSELNANPRRTTFACSAMSFHPLRIVHDFRRSNHCAAYRDAVDARPTPAETKIRFLVLNPAPLEQLPEN